MAVDPKKQFTYYTQIVMLPVNCMSIFFITLFIFKTLKFNTKFYSKLFLILLSILHKPIKYSQINNKVVFEVRYLSMNLEQYIYIHINLNLTIILSALAHTLL